MVEAMTVWGYSMVVWIPVSVRNLSCSQTRGHAVLKNPVPFDLQILCIIPIAILRWILSGIGFVLSGYFLVANIYPVLVSVRQLSLVFVIRKLKSLQRRRTRSQSGFLLL